MLSNIHLQQFVDNYPVITTTEVLEHNFHLASDPDLESMVMKFAHGDCHYLTALLAQYAPEQFDIFLIKSQGNIIHSGVVDKQFKVFFDANGYNDADTRVGNWFFCEDVEIVKATDWEIGQLLDAMQSLDEQDMLDYANEIIYFLKVSKKIMENLLFI